MQQQTQGSQQLGAATYLLLLVLRSDGGQSSTTQAAVYPVLVDILRNKEQHNSQVVELVVEAVAVIAKQGAAACSILVDLGVVT